MYVYILYGVNRCTLLVESLSNMLLVYRFCSYCRKANVSMYACISLNGYNKLCSNALEPSCCRQCNEGERAHPGHTMREGEGTPRAHYEGGRGGTL